MPSELLIAADRTRYVITQITDGRLVAQDRFEPKSASARSPICRKFKVTDEWLINAVEEVRVEGGSKRFPAPADPTPVKPTILIRRIDETDSAGVSVDGDAAGFLTRFLPTITIDRIAKWGDKTALCCLDVDYHDRPLPTEPEARARALESHREWLASTIAVNLTPKPAAWHFSGGGGGKYLPGLHLFYVAIPPYTADELASIAGLRFRALDASAGLELKTVVRGPGGEHVEYAPIADTGGAALASWFDASDVDADERDSWLETKGLVVGRRYDHTYCPIAGTPGYPSKGDPVVVSEEGVYCHRCSGMGLSLGSRRSGWAPWSAILGAPSAGDLGVMIRAIAHWGHAKWVLTAKYGLPAQFAEQAYRAALKAYHFDRPSSLLIPGAFNPHLDDVARVDHQWYSILDNSAYNRDVPGIIAALPATQYATADDPPKIRSNNAAADRYKSAGMDLTKNGYPTIQCVHGCKVTDQWLGTFSRSTQVALPFKGLMDYNSRCRPRYVKKTERMNEAAAWGVLDAVLPGIDRVLIKTAICAFGSAQETRLGMQPIVFVEGPSGTAKTSTIKIAAGIYGARTTDPVYSSDDRIFRQSLYEASQRGPGMILNELLKDTYRVKRNSTPKDALDPLLNLTSDSLYRGNYRDPVPFGRIPSIWITEPKCPPELRDETQLARRIRFWRVSGNKDAWKKTISDSRIYQGDLHFLRAVRGEVNDACDSILSSVIDTFFATPLTWDEQADMLGVKTIDTTTEFEDKDEDLRRLFRLVCAAPALDGRAGKRLGPGWKKIVPNAGEEEDELSYAYRFWADGSGSRFLHSRRLEEKDWSKLLGVEGDVKCDLKNDGINVFIRFSRGPAARPIAINEQIRDPGTL